MIILNPRERFQTTTAAKTHADLVVTPAFVDAISAALLQMQYNEGQPADPVIALASWHRLAGARAFVSVLLNLAEPKQPATAPQNQNLPHRF